MGMDMVRARVLYRSITSCACDVGTTPSRDEMTLILTRQCRDDAQRDEIRMLTEAHRVALVRADPHYFRKMEAELERPTQDLLMRTLIRSLTLTLTWPAQDRLMSAPR